MPSGTSESLELGVVVVAFHDIDTTLECLESLTRQNPPAAALVLVDNTPSGRVAGAVSGRIPSVEILRAPTNPGYAAAVNLGVRQLVSRGLRYVLFLNNDVRLASWRTPR